jgi:hypothetical protein
MMRRAGLVRFAVAAAAAAAAADDDDDDEAGADGAALNNDLMGTSSSSSSTTITSDRAGLQSAAESLRAADAVAADTFGFDAAAARCPTLTFALVPSPPPTAPPPPSASSLSSITRFLLAATIPPSRPLNLARISNGDNGKSAVFPLFSHRASAFFFSADRASFSFRLFRSKARSSLPGAAWGARRREQILNIKKPQVSFCGGIAATYPGCRRFGRRRRQLQRKRLQGVRQQGTSTGLKFVIFNASSSAARQRTDKRLQVILYVLFGIICGWQGDVKQQTSKLLHKRIPQVAPAAWAVNEGSSSTRDRNDDDDDELPLLLMLSLLLLLLIGALPMSCIMRRVLALKGEREEGGRGWGGLKKDYNNIVNAIFQCFEYVPREIADIGVEWEPSWSPAVLHFVMQIVEEGSLVNRHYEFLVLLPPI